MTPVDPDCAAGKHTACSGTAWDDGLDGLTWCGCNCHPVAVVEPTDGGFAALGPDGVDAGTSAREVIQRALDRAAEPQDGWPAVDR